ncbi:MAG: hypothetical protein Q8K75_11200 [Chlamydiales bacterium]|nr:hypothetical protein [Chlamydiales bacterium]
MEAVRSWLAAPLAQQAAACEHINKDSRLGDLLAISTLAVGVIVGVGVILLVAGPAIILVVPVLVLCAGGAVAAPNIWYYDDRPRHSYWGLSNWGWSSPTYVSTGPRFSWFSSPVSSVSYSDSYSRGRGGSYFGGSSSYDHRSGGRQIPGTGFATTRRR